MKGNVKIILIISAGFLFLGIADLPIGYYTFLRILISIQAALTTIFELNRGFNLWVVCFGIIAIMFNPIIPVYLNDKDAWIVIDFITGIIFLIKAITIKSYKS